MGAWGHRGLDNDSAQDWLDGFAETLRFILNHTFWSRWQEEGIAAAEVLWDMPLVIRERLGPHVFSEALEVCEQELLPETLKQWKSPRKRRQYLESLRTRLTIQRKQFPEPKRAMRHVAKKIRKGVAIHG